jgi:hypothetical protein
VAQIQDILDDKCPNCNQDWETSAHLNWCPDNGRSLLFKESIRNLATWMHHHDQTETELAYLIEKYLLYCSTRSFTFLVDEGDSCSKDLQVPATSQDLIEWTEFLHSKVLVDIATIQWIHYELSPLCRLTGDS